MITVENLYHSYSNDGDYSIKDVSFSIGEGEIFGFLGPSGAGKSTTQNLITGLLPLQKGRVQVAGYDMAKPHLSMYNDIGVCFEQPNLYGKMTAEENLRFYAKLFDVPTRDPQELIDMVGLSGVGKKKCGEFSKGMRQRINFARSMLNSPKLWFLDEPTSGLDPSIADTIKDIIRTCNKKGVTVFLTTHNMYIADDLCDRVAFIVDGEIKLIDSPKELKLRYGKQLVDVEYIDGGQVQKKMFSTQDAESRRQLAEIVQNHTIRTMHTEEATLEQIFIQVTGKGLTGDEANSQP
jgi:fluoroquinolone transport system ATP-binding protein